MAFNLLVIRHAESANNVIASSTDYEAFIATRSHEPGITARGEQQALALADYLARSKHVEFVSGKGVNLEGYGVTKMVASPMQRTLLTAWPSAQMLGVPLEVWPDIFEQGGLFEGSPWQPESLRTFPGLTRANYAERFPGVILPEEITDEGWWRGGYEDLDACSARAARVAQRVLELGNAAAASGEQTTLAMVSHGTFINQFMHHLLDVPNRAGAYFFTANTGITRIEFVDAGFRSVRYINRTEHLPPELLTR